jgi:hypothetical protein
LCGAIRRAVLCTMAVSGGGVLQSGHDLRHRQRRPRLPGLPRLASSQRDPTTLSPNPLAPGQIRLDTYWQMYVNVGFQSVWVLICTAGYYFLFWLLCYCRVIYFLQARQALALPPCTTSCQQRARVAAWPADGRRPQMLVNKLSCGKLYAAYHWNVNQVTTLPCHLMAGACRLTLPAPRPAHPHPLHEHRRGRRVHEGLGRDARRRAVCARRGLGPAQHSPRRPREPGQPQHPELGAALQAQFPAGGPRHPTVPQPTLLLPDRPACSTAPG